MATLTINTVDGTGWVGDPVPGMNACWAQAVQDLQDALVPPINSVTVTITRQYTGGGLASSTVDPEFTSWSSMRSAYLALTPSNSIQAANWTGALLPSSAPTTELGNFLETPRILSVAVGRTTGSGFTNTLTFGAGAQWDTTSVRGDTNSGAGHYTAYGVMMHELTEALGRIGWADTLGAGGGAAAADMFVYSSAGVHCTQKAVTRFITADGTNPLYFMNTVPGNSDACDAAGGSPAFNAFGTVNLACSRSSSLPLMAEDWQWMTLLGWNLSSTGQLWAGLSSPPTCSVNPVASGTPTAGQTLSTTDGTWANSPSFTYQWQKNGSNIGGQTSNSTTVLNSQRDGSLRCVVTGTNGSGNASANSNSLGPVITTTKASPFLR